MDVERALVAKIVATGQLETAVSKGVRPDLFVDPECREVLEFILAHTRKYGSPPSMKALEHERPDFRPELVQETLDYVIDQFFGLAKRRFAQEQVVELAKLTNDPDLNGNLEMAFLEASRRLVTLIPSTKTHSFIGGMGERIEQYKQQKESGHKIGIPIGFYTLDRWTGGLQPGEFAVVAAFSGIGKTTFLKTVAFNVWSLGLTPMFVTLEEPAKQIARTWDAMAAGLDYQRMKDLDLAPKELENWEQYREKLLNSSNDIPVIDKLRPCTPDHVLAETMRHKPDLVIVDYVSLMRSNRPAGRNMSLWQSVSEITQDLKQNAMQTGVPILAAAQTNRLGRKEGAELDNVASSISITQDPDIVIGLFADDEMKVNNEMEIRVNKNRDGTIGKFRAVWDHERKVFREKKLGDMFRRD